MVRRPQFSCGRGWASYLTAFHSRGIGGAPISYFEMTILLDETMVARWARFVESCPAAETGRLRGGPGGEISRDTEIVDNPTTQ
jgi:hypothetical protein